MNLRVGVIGKAKLTKVERNYLRTIGRSIAKLGHTLVIIPAPGTASEIRKGIEAEGGKIECVDSAVLNHSDRTLIYADEPLLHRLTLQHPDLETRPYTTIMSEPADLAHLQDVLDDIIRDYNLG